MKKNVMLLLLLIPIITCAQKNIDSVDYNALLDLTLQNRELKKDSVAMEMAVTYKSKYLDKNDPARVLSPKQRNFFAFYSSLFKLNDKFFEYFYAHSKEADNSLNAPDFSNWFVNRLITDSLINPIVKNNSNPEWAQMETQISKKYDAKTAHKVVLMAKIDWYSKRKDWDNYIKYGLESFELRGIPTTGSESFNLNDFIYGDVFSHSEDPAVLSKCIGYMEAIVKNDPDSHIKIDTYACLLYKAGNKNKAITIEEQALKIAKELNDSGVVAEYEDKINKMRNNLPTWN